MGTLVDGASTKRDVSFPRGLQVLSMWWNSSVELSGYFAVKCGLIMQLKVLAKLYTGVGFFEKIHLNRYQSLAFNIYEITIKWFKKLLISLLIAVFYQLINVSFQLFDGVSSKSLDFSRIRKNRVKLTVIFLFIHNNETVSLISLLHNHGLTCFQTFGCILHVLNDDADVRWVQTPTFFPILEGWTRIIVEIQFL